MCHVLIIEDEPLIASDLADIAVEAGATSVEVAASPSEAMASAAARLPAVVFSDVQIIGGTGPEAVVAIRERFGFVPAIFITASPQGCEGIEAVAVLLKPVSRHHLISAFRSVAPE